MTYIPPSIPPYIPYGQPQLKDVLDALKKDILLSTNCHAIATVESFIPQDVNGLSKLTASMNYTKTFTVQNSQGQYVNQQQSYPTLVDCPVVVLGGGAVSLQMPIAKGDQCLILFNDRDLNNWWAAPNGTAGSLATSRLHSFSDAIALVGFKNLGFPSDSIRSLLTNGNIRLGINPSTNKATIQNTADGTLGTSLGNLVSILSTFFTSVSAATTTAQVAAAASVASSSLSSDQVSSKLSGLLE